MTDPPHDADTLYVSTYLEVWSPPGPRGFARDVAIEGVPYRRLDPDYWVWLFRRFQRVREAFDRGQVARESFDGLRVRWQRVLLWSWDRFSDEELLRAMAAQKVARYEPPRVPAEGFEMPAIASADERPTSSAPEDAEITVRRRASAGALAARRSATTEPVHPSQVPRTIGLFDGGGASLPMGA